MVEKLDLFNGEEKVNNEIRFDEYLYVDGSWKSAGARPIDYVKIIEIPSINGKSFSNRFRLFLAQDKGCSIQIYRMKINK